MATVFRYRQTVLSIQTIYCSHWEGCHSHHHPEEGEPLRDVRTGSRWYQATLNPNTTHNKILISITQLCMSLKH